MTTNTQTRFKAGEFIHLSDGTAVQISEVEVCEEDEGYDVLHFTHPLHGPAWALLARYAKRVERN